MKYYSEETVKNLLQDTKVEILTRNKFGYLVDDCRIIRPKAEDYPSIEIPDKHGKIIDGTKLCEEFKGECWEELLMFVSNAPTILEATE